MKPIEIEKIALFGLGSKKDPMASIDPEAERSRTRR